MPGRVILDYSAFVDAFPELRSPLYNKKHRIDEKSAHVIGPDMPADAWKISSRISLPRGDLWKCFDEQGYNCTAAQALLCSAFSPGYSLVNKQWAYFDIDLLKPIEWPLNPLRELEISHEWKLLLKDIILEHFSKPESDGVISEKGEGRIFLLYGPPGCGKTLTAGKNSFSILTVQP